MATKAQRLREELDLAKHNKPKRPTVVKSATHLTHNEAKRVARKTGYAFEEGGARPSRKSTRAGANRIKHDSVIATSKRARTVTPEARAARR